MKKINLACKIFGIVILAASFCAGCEEAIPPTQTALPTQSPIPTSTPEPTITPTKTTPSTEWQLSPDGHIYYKESELYDGMFTINKEHPEWVEQYWEDTIRGLWNLNNIGENSDFINRFPTDDALVQFLKDGGEPVNNLWIPVIYPDSRRQFMRQATLKPIGNSIDLSQFAIVIYKPTIEEIYKYSPSFATGTKYVSYLGAVAEVMTEEIEMNGKNLLKFTFRRDLLVDATRLIPLDNSEPTIREEFVFPAMSDDKTPEENLLGGIQLVRSWPITMQIKDTDWAYAIVPGNDPIKVNFNSIVPLFGEYSEITTLEGSPISLR